MTVLYKVDYTSPIGVIEIIGTTEVITSIMFSKKGLSDQKPCSDTPSVLRTCYQQLDEYFKGQRMEFTFPYEVQGTDFQRST